MSQPELLYTTCTCRACFSECVSEPTLFPVTHCSDCTRAHALPVAPMLLRPRLRAFGGHDLLSGPYTRLDSTATSSCWQGTAAGGAVVALWRGVVALTHCGMMAFRDCSSSRTSGRPVFNCLAFWNFEGILWRVRTRQQQTVAESPPHS